MPPFTRLSLATCAATLATLVISGCSQSTPAPRVIDIPTSDGIVLKGTLFSTAKPGPAVLMLHQCDEQRKVWDSLGVKLARAGITAMSVDYRGYGESGGVPHDKLPPAEFESQRNDQWPVDIDSAYQVLLRQPGVEPSQIGVAGGSCGVQNAQQFAARAGTAVRALALLAGGLDQRGRAFIARDSAPPLFLGAAADDNYANFVDIQGWYAALSKNSQTRVIEYPNGGHAAVVFRKHPQFADSIAKWFAAVLHSKPDLLPVTNGHVMDSAVVQTLREIDRAGGTAIVGEQLAAARKLNPAAKLFPEYQMNVLGYEHAQAKDFTGAIEIMKLNTVAYPNSPNAFDSLGDVYLAAGDKQAAIAAAKHALVLLEKDTANSAERKQNIRDSATGKIKLIGGK